MKSQDLKPVSQVKELLHIPAFTILDEKVLLDATRRVVHSIGEYEMNDPEFQTLSGKFGKVSLDGHAFIGGDHNSFFSIHRVFDINELCYWICCLSKNEGDPETNHDLNLFLEFINSQYKKKAP
jgi:hypothetical protein